MSLHSALIMLTNTFDFNNEGYSLIVEINNVVEVQFSNSKC